MTIYTARILCLPASLDPATEAAVRFDDRLLPLDAYATRGPCRVAAASIDEALGKVWTLYQNVSEDHMTPDGGRSLMVGDMVAVRSDGSTAPERSLVCARTGWREVRTEDAPR